MDGASFPGMVRIGEFSRRLGVSEHVLRAWERRYGLLRPARSAGGFRLYSDADARRVRHMQAGLAEGLSAAEAARAATRGEPDTPPQAGWSAPDSRPPETPRPDGAGDRREPARAAYELASALDGFDEPRAQAVLDRLLSTLTVETVIREVVLPYLRELGERWQREEVNVAQEHFASNVIRGRLAGLGRGWGHGQGPLALLACPPGELHDIALLAFGVVLHRHGWRIGFLGADTPLRDLVAAAAATHPDLVVLAATTSEPFRTPAAELARLAGTVPLAIAGAGATPALAEAIGAHLFADDPVTAAEAMPVPAPRQPSR